MNRLCFQYLAIYNNEFCPKVYKLCQRELKTLPQTQMALKHIAKNLEMPKWWNFVKSGHTESKQASMEGKKHDHTQNRCKAVRSFVGCRYTPFSNTPFHLGQRRRRRRLFLRPHLQTSTRERENEGFCSYSNIFDLHAS